MGVSGLLTDYLVPILLLTDVLLNLNGVLIAVHIALLLRNLTRVPRSSGGLWWRSDRGRRFSSN